MNQKQEIVKLFNAMQSKEDLVALLNYVRPMVYPESKFVFSLRQLNYYSSYKKNTQPNDVLLTVDKTLLQVLVEGGAKIKGNKYKTFVVKKKSGKTRTIHAPNRGLKAIQKCLNVIFQSVHKPHKSAFGFVEGKSIVDNARIHQNQNYVYNIDLKDFFPSIDQARVRARFMIPPLNLGENDQKIKLAGILAILSCTSLETERLNDETGKWENKTLNVLPQGAPTSPVITNMICERLDIRLSGLAKRFGCKYSRYADDITFSSMHQVYQKNGEFINELHRIIKEQNFHIQEKKTRLQKQGFRQEVTGLIVNESVNVNQRYVKQLRQWLYYWEQYGFDKANGIFQSKYHVDKGHAKKGMPSLENVLWGKLEYLKMVKGAKNAIYISLRERYSALIGLPIEQILDIWTKQGIDMAMVEYYGYNSAIGQVDSSTKVSKTLASEIEDLKNQGFNITEIKVDNNKLSLISDIGIKSKSYLVGKKYLNIIGVLSIDNSDELKKWVLIEKGIGGNNWLYYQDLEIQDIEKTNL